MAITEEQRAQRRNGIGSSDAPKILGVDPYAGPADVLAEKLGLVESSGEMSEAAGWGTLLEPVVLRAVEQELGRVVVPGGDPWRKGVLFAHLDGQLDERREGCPPVEAKCVFQPSRAAGYERGRGNHRGLPARVLVQVYHQMICTSAREAYVGVLFMGDDGDEAKAQIYHVPGDDDICAHIEHTLTEWWERHVVRREPLDSTPNMDTLKRIVRVPGKTVPIDRALIDEYRQARVDAERAERRLEQAKVAVLTALADAEYGQDESGHVVVAYKSVERTSIDTRLLEQNHPDLAREYRRTIRYRRLVVENQRRQQDEQSGA